MYASQLKHEFYHSSQRKILGKPSSGIGCKGSSAFPQKIGYAGSLFELAGIGAGSTLMASAFATVVAFYPAIASAKALP